MSGRSDRLASSLWWCGVDVRCVYAGRLSASAALSRPATATTGVRRARCRCLPCLLHPTPRSHFTGRFSLTGRFYTDAARVAVVDQWLHARVLLVRTHAPAAMKRRPTLSTPLTRRLSGAAPGPPPPPGPPQCLTGTVHKTVQAWSFGSAAAMACDACTKVRDNTTETLQKRPRNAEIA